MRRYYVKFAVVEPLGEILWIGGNDDVTSNGYFDDPDPSVRGAAVESLAVDLREWADSSACRGAHVPPGRVVILAVIPKT
jgi:hypothetical protein